MTVSRSEEEVYREVVLESESLRAAIFPGLGGLIASLRDRAGHEYLAQSLWPRPAGLPFSAGYLEGGLGGVDECLPAIATGRYPSGPWPAWQVPDHGELWMRPWDVVERTEGVLELAIRGAVLPYTLVRRLSLMGDVMRAEYRLANMGAAALPIVWAAHALLAPSAGATVDIGEPATLRLDGTCSPGLEPFRTAPYPRLTWRDRVVDLRSWDNLPEGFYLKGFAPLQSGQPVRLHHPGWGTTLEIRTEAHRRLHIGLWLNRSGIPPEEPVDHLALEPTFGSADALDRALADGSCLMLEPGSEERWSMTYTVRRARA